MMDDDCIPEEEEPSFDPEDCSKCDTPRSQFGRSDFFDGCWVCPECGQTQR